MRTYSGHSVPTMEHEDTGIVDVMMAKTWTIDGLTLMHRTTLKAWEEIKKCGEIRPMGRNCVY